MKVASLLLNQLSLGRDERGIRPRRYLRPPDQPAAQHDARVVAFLVVLHLLSLCPSSHVARAPRVRLWWRLDVGGGEAIPLRLITEVPAVVFPLTPAVDVVTGRQAACERARIVDVQLGPPARCCIAVSAAPAGMLTTAAGVGPPAPGRLPPAPGRLPPAA